MDNIVRIAGMGTNDHWMKLWLFHRSERDPVLILPGSERCIPRDGMEDVCRTDRWLCSTLWVENNQCQNQCGMVFEWRWFQRGPHKVTMTSAFGSL